METPEFLNVFDDRCRERRESGYSCDTFYSGSSGGSDCGGSRRDSGNYLRESYDSGLSASPSPVPIFNIDLEITKDDTKGGSSSSSGGSTGSGSPPRRKKKKKRLLCESLSVTHFSDVYRLSGEMLGEGSYGRVESCEHVLTGQEYAVKIISKQCWHFSRPKILKEIELYYLCQGQKEIIQMVEYFEEDNEFYLVFEKAKGGPLLDQIQRRIHFTEKEAACIIRDLASALAFLHGKGIAHRDLKPENVLCSGDGDNFLPIKLCDFDLCSAVYQTITTPKLQSPVGSVEYMAPEVVQAFTWDMDIFDYDSDSEDSEEGLELTYDKRCDLWSLGIIAYILLSGYLPFSGSCGRDCGWEDRGEECAECQQQLFVAIKSGELQFPEEYWTGVSSEAKDLIKQLLVRDASQRIKASSVLNHPWILSGGDCHPKAIAKPTTNTTEPPTAPAAAVSTRPLDTPHVLRRRHRSVHDLLYSELASNALALKLAKDQASTAIQRASEVGSTMKKSATVIEFQQSANVDIATPPIGSSSSCAAEEAAGEDGWRKKPSFFCPTAATAAASGDSGIGSVGVGYPDKVMRRQASLIVFPQDLATSNDLCRRWEF